MDENWDKVREIFDAAIRRPAAERRGFVVESCGGNNALASEVESLLASHESAGEFLESPLVARIREGAAEPSEETEIGNYTVVRRIGEGGMGTVYLANDARLDRHVAIKLLGSQIGGERSRAGRFRQEALATSRLNHPNIVTIFEFGEWSGRDYIVTEFVEGATLRERLRSKKPSVGEALNIALQIASALEAAHRSGVVHRDIKPENVMIRADGLVKVVDFGIAKYRPRNEDVEALVDTAAGEILGTVTYMSPEQARGFDVDARTDIWSLGVILYEMLAGRAPFTGETRLDRLAAILSRDPDPLPTNGRTSAELQRVVDRALAKDRDDRYSEVSEVTDALQRLRQTNDENIPSSFAIPFRGAPNPRRGRYVAALAAFVLVAGIVGLYAYFFGFGRTSSGDKRSIAVLPLKPIDSASRDVAYEIGIADSLIQRLGSAGIPVRPLSAVRKYESTEQDPVEAGKEQQTDLVLASNYQVESGKIRVTVQIWNVGTGLLEGTFKTEKVADDVFAMQDAVSEEIGVYVLSRYPAPSARPVNLNRGTTNEEAYRLYLQAMNLIDKETAADSKRAIGLFDQALALDPNFARAWANKARAHCNFAHLGGSSADAEFAIAKPAIDRAFSIDPDLPDAHAVLGIIRTDYDWNFAEGEREFRFALEKSPGSDIFYRWYANRLAANGKFDQAIENAKTAIDLNPAYIVHQVFLGRVFYYARRNDDAIDQLERALEVDPGNLIALWTLWQAYHVKGDTSRAFGTFFKFQKLAGVDAATLKVYEKSYDGGGWNAVLQTHLKIAKRNAVNGSSAFGIAQISAMLDDREQALEYLEKAVSERSLQLPSLAGDPAFDKLRGDPRFTAVLDRVVRK